MEKLYQFVPSFLEADTRPLLVKAMLQQNLEHQMSYRYFDIQYDARAKKWVAWFYPEFSVIKKGSDG